MAEPQADIDAARSDPAPHPRRRRWQVLASVALGGATGAAARHGVALWLGAAEQFPLATLTVNLTGCAMIGVVMVLVTETGAAHPLLRPAIGTGFLGGYTTFSTYATDAIQLATRGQYAQALTYLAMTLLGALAAVWLAALVTRRMLTRRSR